MSMMGVRRRLVTIATQATIRRRVYRTVGTLAAVSALGASGYYLQGGNITRRKIRVQWEGAKRFIRYNNIVTSSFVLYYMYIVVGHFI